MLPPGTPSGPIPPDRLPAAFADLIVAVPDYPRPGVGFKDITPLLASPDGLAATIEHMAEAAPAEVDVVIGLEARGFIFGAPVAYALGVGFVPVRKPGKLPRAVEAITYDLEYGTDTVAVHTDAFWPGARVLIVDDILATGGTVSASAALVRRLEAEVAAVLVVAELAFLRPRDRLAAEGLDDIRALVCYEDA